MKLQNIQCLLNEYKISNSPTLKELKHVSAMNRMALLYVLATKNLK